MAAWAHALGRGLRGGLIAAGSPTPGAVGTIRDMVGGMTAAEEDEYRQRQRALAEQQALEEQEMRRRDVEMRTASHEANIAARQAQEANYKAQEQRALRQGGEDPEKVRAFNFHYKKAIEAGRTPQQAYAEASGFAMGNTTGWMEPRKAPTTGDLGLPANASKADQMLAIRKRQSFLDSREGAEEDPTGEERAQLGEIYGTIAGAGKPKEKPYQPKNSEEARTALLWEELLQLKENPTPQAAARRAQIIEELRKIDERPRAERRPMRDTIINDDDEIVVIDTEKLGPTGIKARKRATSEDPYEKTMKLMGGGAPSPEPQKPEPKKDPQKKNVTPIPPKHLLREGVRTPLENPNTGKEEVWTLRNGKPTQLK